MKIVTNINSAQKRVGKAMSDLASGGVYAAALSSEGYVGGYYQALSDVLLVMRGFKPNTRNYWDDFKD